MNAIQRTICASLVLAATACGVTLRAEEPHREFALSVNAANATLRGGDVDGAIQQYTEVRSMAPESADLSYNMAVAQFRKGEVAAAAPLFEAAATSENDTLAANARYNLGNCNYTAGLKLAETDRKAAIQQLESAIENYRSSLTVDTNNADARANIELAAQLIEKLREEQEQQEQQQNQQNQQDQQQSSDEQQDNQQQQGSQGQQDEQQQNENQQKQDQQQQQQDEQQQSGDEQEENQEQQDSQSESSQQGKEQQQDQQKQEQQDQLQNQQSSQDQQKSQSQEQQPPSQSAQQQPQDTGNPEEQKSEQQGEKPPQGELSAANEEEAKNEKEKREAVAFDPAKDGEMTQQEAEKMLQAIRDRDLLRRYNRQQNERQNYVPVDRDW